MTSSICRSFLLGTLIFVSPITSAIGQGKRTSGYVESLRANTVRVQAAGMSGFGFIVGLSGGDLLLATAGHTLGYPNNPVSEAEVCFFHQPEACQPASVVYFGDPIGSLPALDLAILSVSYPDRLPWRPDAMDTRVVLRGSIWSIGRDRDWYIPSQPGEIVALQSDSSSVLYENMEVARGVSGAPIVTSEGIAAMHVKSAGQNQAASGIQIAAIRGRVEDQVGGQWILLPRADCDQDEGQQRLIAGREFLVYLDPTRPAAALETMARLNCLGARTLPRPVLSPEEWSGEKITYMSGDLRTARVLQTILSFHGRLEILLGNPEADAEIWIR